MTQALVEFLSADPHIQAPYNTQSYNRYSYVLNNPLKYTDPSGYFFKWLARKVKKFVKRYGRQILAIGLGIVTQQWALAAKVGCICPRCSFWFCGWRYCYRQSKRSY